MFWNKKDKPFTRTEISDVLVNHANTTGNLIRKKMEVFREQVIKKDDVLIERVKKLESILEALCPCKDVELKYRPTLNSRHVISKDGLYELYGKTMSIYNKKCNVCGKLIPITKAQYLTYQLETIKSSLKECE